MTDLFILFILEPGFILEAIFKYGATGVLAIWVLFNRRDIDRLNKAMKSKDDSLLQLHENHKKDLRQRDDENRTIIAHLKKMIK